MLGNQTIEWKSIWRDEYIKWISGFANAEGGRLEIGKNDDGKVVGVRNANQLLEVLPNKIRDILGVVVDVKSHDENGLLWLSIEVVAYPSPISYKGEYHYRTGSTKQELKGAALNQFLLRKQGKHWDSVPRPHVQVDDLREAVINAITHKDYSSGIPIQIKVFEDRVIIWNQGELPHNWSVENLTSVHQSIPFNPSIAEVFFRAGFIESWGRGIDTIVNLSTAYGNDAPRFSNELTGWPTRALLVSK
jgi:predicted HTH transcriptional regulator